MRLQNQQLKQEIDQLKVCYAHAWRLMCLHSAASNALKISDLKLKLSGLKLKLSGLKLKFRGCAKKIIG